MYCYNGCRCTVTSSVDAPLHRRSMHHYIVGRCSITFTQIERFKSGNGLYTDQSFNHGFVTGIQTGTIQNLQYGWDQATGNLSWRKDANRNLTENFTYDKLDRLTDITGNTSAHFDFASNGNITSGTFAGNYTYHPEKPHAVEE